MPIQKSPSARQTRSQARAHTVITPTPRAPLDGTPAVPQPRAQLYIGPHLEGRLSRTTFKGSGEDSEEEDDNSGEEEESEGTEGFPSPVGASQGTGGPTIDQSNHPTILNHPYWPSCRKCLKLWPIFKQLHLLKHQDYIYEGTRIL
ncbi:hypothetical protein O181_005157 [Austropuccinia psidii MF-1]|uniref:Uncharacterized protein n=1 Tax=Austropuccinia psidii MF-1 TaxID=1389203 RepID=A0A9Q3BHL2_9BASI|nr:hypothetical protein [Austropuccinia psidii MF-1]